VDARLLVAGHADTDGDGAADEYIEPAHDALVRAWDKLLVWKREAEEYLPLQRRLTQAANEWAQAAGDVKIRLLWNNNPRLPQLQQTLLHGAKAALPHSFLNSVRQAIFPPTRRALAPTWLNRIETEFVWQSIMHRATMLRRIIAITAVVIVAFALLALFANIQRGEAQRSADARATEVVVRTTAQAEAVSQSYARATQEAIAIVQRDWARSRELAVVAQSQIAVDPESALLIAIEANTVTRTLESEDVLRSALRASPLRGVLGGEESQIQTLAFAHNRQQLFIASRTAEQMSAQFLDFPTLEPQLATPPISAQDISAQYIFEARYAPDDKHLLALDDLNQVHVWESATGAELLSTPGVSAAWFNDGVRLAVLNMDFEQKIEVWDLVSRKVLAAIPVGEDQVYCPCTLHVVPNDQQLILVGWPAGSLVQQQAEIDGTVAIVWDLQSGNVVERFALNFSPSFSSDGRYMAYGMDNDVILRDLLNSRSVFTGTAHSGLVDETVFSPDGTTLASASDDGSIRTWWIGGSEEQVEIGTISSMPILNVDFMAFSPDRPLFVATDGATVRVWNTQSISGPPLTFATGTESLQSVAFAPQGDYFVTLDTKGKLQLWSENVGEEWATFHPLQKNAGGYIDAHFAPDSAHLGVAFDNGVHLFDLWQRTPLSTTFTFSQSIRGFAFSPSGANLIAHSERAVGWWDVASGQSLGALEIITGNVSSAILSADGRSGAAINSVIPTKGRPDFPLTYVHRVLLWDTAQGELRRLAGEWPEYRSIDTLAFSPDGASLLVSGVTDLSEAGGTHEILVWDTTTGALRFGLEFGPETNIGYTPDGRSLVVVRRESIEMHNAMNGMIEAKFDAGAQPLSSVSFSLTGDGRRMIVPDAFTSTARVWDLETQQPLFQLRGHSSSISFVQFSQDGKLLLTASSGDNSIRLWDGETGALLTVFDYDRRMELSSDGNFVFIRQSFGAPQIYLTHFDELLKLAHSRVFRQLTCAERRDFLHAAVDCPVATPLPVAS
jgi:WD40 repeat protein